MLRQANTRARSITRGPVQIKLAAAWTSAMFFGH